MQIQRFDTSEALTWTTTPTGGIRARARLTRVGVFPYRLSDGTTRLEYRPPEEVLAPESIESLKGAAVTDLHPEDFVTKDTWKTLAEGVVADDVTADTDSVIGSLLVQSAGLLAGVKRGDRVEASCGYAALWDPTPGVTPTGERYDGVQRNIRYNHVGLGPKGWGRQGPTVSILRADSGACIPSDRDTKKPEGGTMTKHRVDGVDYEAGSESHIQAVDRALAAAVKKATEAETALATATKRADAAEAAIKPEAIAKRVAFRADLLSKARTSLGAEYLKDEEAALAADDDTIIRDILKKVAPAIKTESMDHMQLMTALQVVFAMTLGASGDAPAAPPAGADGAPLPPTPPGAGLDSITQVRGAPTKQPEKKNDNANDLNAAYAEAQQRHANAWRGSQKGN